MYTSTSYDISIIETKTYIKKASKILTVEERSELIGLLAFSPESGDVIRGTGGVRKLRFALGNRGKSHGARVLYFFKDLSMPLFLLSIYKKSSKMDLSSQERNEYLKLTEELVKVHHLLPSREGQRGMKEHR